jgi:hypothetical protein
LLLAVPERAAACSGPAPTFADVIARSELIVEGTVTRSLVNGLTVDLDVQEVFKGSVPGPVVRIGPAEDPGSRGCETTLVVGSHVIVGVMDVDAVLNALGSAVWYVAPDGSISSPGGYYMMAANVDDLRAKLRNAVPDSALSPARREWSLVGVAFLVVAGIFAMRRLASRRFRAVAARNLCMTLTTASGRRNGAA